MNLTLKVWRQKNREDKELENYNVTESLNTVLLEMLDVLNEQLITEGKRRLTMIVEVWYVFFVYKWRSTRS